MLALSKIPAHLGYLVLFALVGGVPVPGETALIAAAVLARHGTTLDLATVIAAAAMAAIVGDNLGNLIGRQGGRRLLERPGLLQQHRRQILITGEPFFEAPGPQGGVARPLDRWFADRRRPAGRHQPQRSLSPRSTSNGAATTARRHDGRLANRR